MADNVSFVVHALQHIEGSLSLVIPRKPKRELLASHFSKIILYVLYPSEAKKVEEGISILVRENRISSYFSKLTDCLPVQLSTCYMQRRHSVLIL